MSVYLWREGERTVRETRLGLLCRFTSVTVFEPTEIRTNTGSVSYPKNQTYRKSQGQEPGDNGGRSAAEAGCERAARRRNIQADVAAGL